MSLAARRALSVLRTNLRAAAEVAAVPAEEAAALQAKAQGPWGELTVSEKTKLYRMAYPQTANEIRAANTSSDGPKVLAGVVAGVGFSYFLYTLLHARAQPVPRTFTDEWKAAEKEKALERNSNPVFGMSAGKQ